MRTIGVDLSAEDANTCLAAIEWREGRANLIELLTAVDNATIVSRAAGATKVGIDCPFGWPVPFLDFVTAYDRGELAVPSARPIDWRRTLANRTTDLVVRAETGLVPLSVSADRIAHATFRCAALLTQLSAAGLPVDRSGQTGVAVEVYPAASLRRWGLAHRGYKRGPNRAELGRLVDALRTAAPWLDLGEFGPLCRGNDDAFDAVVAAIAARVAERGRAGRPTADQHRLALREGWIAVPDKGSLRPD